MQSYNSKRKKARKHQKERVHQSFLEQVSRHPGVRSITEEDFGIQVELTGDDDFYCFRVKMEEATVLLHARSVVDLHRKLGLALLDWLGESMIMATGMLEEYGEADSNAVV